MEQPVEVNRKTDGQAGPPVLPTPGKPNAALKEALANPPKPEDGVCRSHPYAAHLVVKDAARGLVGTPDGSPRRRKIALCGFASSTRHYIVERCADPEWEIWGLNQLYRHIPRADAWFDIHYNWDKETVPGTDHRQWARDCGIPFYMYDRQPDVPTSVKYPLDAILGIYQADYFTSTIPYMLALALLEIDAAVQGRMQQWFRDLQAQGQGEQLLDPRFHIQDVVKAMYGDYTIGIYGIDLIVGGEYFHEKPCAEFWVGAACLGRGIRVEIPAESALCKQLHRYGYDAEPNQLVTSAEIGAHKQAIVAERDEQLKKLYMLEGVLQADERWEQLITLRARGAIVT